MTDKDPLITDLKTRREAFGWTVSDLSERCGIDEKFLRDWEGGVGAPRLDAAQSWSAALGIRLALVPAGSDAGQGLRIDWERRGVTVAGKPIRLTPMEWRGLERLAWTPGELVTHQALYRYLYGDERPYRAQSTAVRVLITKLRRLLPLRIEARWGQGYVVSGLDPRPHPPVASNDTEERTAAPTPSTRNPRLGLALPNLRPARPEFLDLGERSVHRVAAAPSRPDRGRAEELGVIERFLAERGATRCPDAATIQQSPLPTLVWDKIKRKWVRPPMNGRAAS
jgi:transcriptional regulator with XRE-family HTH domain